MARVVALVSVPCRRRSVATQCIGGVARAHHRVICRRTRTRALLSQARFRPERTLMYNRAPAAPSLASVRRYATRVPLRDRNQRFLLYLLSASMGVLGLSYAAVPLYKIFCRATGYGGTTQNGLDSDSATRQRANEAVLGARQLCVQFNADTAGTMPWKFQPQNVRRPWRNGPGLLYG